MYVMVRPSVPSDAFVAAATGVAQVHRPRTLLRRAKFLQPSLKASLTMPSALCGFLTKAAPPGFSLWSGLRFAWLSQSSNRRLGHDWATKSCLHGQHHAGDDGHRLDTAGAREVITEPESGESLHPGG